MRYLILGGAGFIGTNLVKHLLGASQHNFVDVLDNLSTGSLENLQTIGATNNERFSFTKGDVANLDDFFIVAQHGRPDVIYNLACPASPIHYQADPVQTILTTTSGVYNALRWAEQVGSRFFHASTSEVYGDPKVHPQPESYHGDVNTWGPRACYDEGKRLAETLCYEFRHRVDVRVGRIFNTYGPYMAANDGRVVSNFILQALKNQPITIYGDGSQTRSFQYIEDLLWGIKAIMSNKVHEPINLGTTHEFTIKQLAEEVIRITKSSSTIEYKPIPKDDPVQRRPDNSKLKALDWCSMYTLTQGLTHTIEYFKHVTV